MIVCSKCGKVIGSSSIEIDRGILCENCQRDELKEVIESIKKCEGEIVDVIDLEERERADE